MIATPDPGSPDRALVRFARAHLTSRAHRAVYSVLAGASDSWWSPDEVAGATREDRHEIDVALRQLTAARIVEVRSLGDDPRYRWLFDTASLDDPTAASVARIDPVCGMPVAADSPFQLEDGSGLHRFCSLRCLTVARRRVRLSTPPTP